MDPIQSAIDALMGPQPSGSGGQPSGNAAGGGMPPGIDEYIRGPDGKIAGARMGRTMVKFVRGQDGNINGMQVVGQSPQELPQPQDQGSVPTPLG